MADGGPPAPQPLPAVLTAVFPAPHVQLPAPPTQHAVPPVQLAVAAVQPGPMPHLNWSHFKPTSAGKPDEDEEAHLLRTNNWMDTHAFLAGVKVQRFYLTFCRRN